MAKGGKKKFNEAVVYELPRNFRKTLIFNSKNKLHNGIIKRKKSKKKRTERRKKKKSRKLRKGGGKTTMRTTGLIPPGAGSVTLTPTPQYKPFF
jgi:hypothetical protein